MQRPAMPYFDRIFERLGQGPAALVDAFGTRHVHWGDFHEPAWADGSLAGFAAASEALTRRLTDLGGPLAPGARVLDVGCGFGGTISSLNERFAPLDLVGLNIDRRQLERAQTLVRPQAANRVRLVHGDACALPFGDASFDRVLAVECIFHFSGRRRFFREAARVLRPGGTLSLSDFVPYGPTVPLLGLHALVYGRTIAGFFGRANKAICTRRMYEWLGRSVGLRLDHAEDISARTLPTYPLLRSLLREAELPQAERSVRCFEGIARRGWLRYWLLSFIKR